MRRRALVATMCSGIVLATGGSAVAEQAQVDLTVSDGRIKVLSAPDLVVATAATPAVLRGTLDVGSGEVAFGPPVFTAPPVARDGLAVPGVAGRTVDLRLAVQADGGFAGRVATDGSLVLDGRLVLRLDAVRHPDGATATCTAPTATTLRTDDVAVPTAAGDPVQSYAGQRLAADRTLALTALSSGDVVLTGTAGDATVCDDLAKALGLDQRKAVAYRLAGTVAAPSSHAVTLTVADARVRRGEDEPVGLLAPGQSLTYAGTSDLAVETAFPGPGASLFFPRTALALPSARLALPLASDPSGPTPVEIAFAPAADLEGKLDLKGASPQLRPASEAPFADAELQARFDLTYRIGAPPAAGAPDGRVVCVAAGASFPLRAALAAPPLRAPDLASQPVSLADGSVALTADGSIPGSQATAAPSPRCAEVDAALGGHLRLRLAGTLSLNAQPAPPPPPTRKILGKVRIDVRGLKRVRRGSRLRLRVRVRNSSAVTTSRGVRLRVAVPRGLTASPRSRAIGTLKPRRSRTVTVVLRVGRAARTTSRVTFTGTAREGVHTYRKRVTVRLRR